MRVKLWLAIVCLILPAASVAAQSTTGTISGQVSDSQGLSASGRDGHRDFAKHARCAGNGYLGER